MIKNEDKPVEHNASYNKEDVQSLKNDETNIEKVREILVGQQTRELERRVTLLDGRLSHESDNLHEEVKRLVTTLEQYFRKEVESTNERLKNEQNERLVSSQEAHSDLEEATKAIEKKIMRIEAQAAKQHRELRDQIFEQSKNLSDEIGNKYKAILSSLGKTVDDLEVRKPDREALS